MKIGITGVDGFIGRQLAETFKNRGDTVLVITGDIRDPETFKGIDYSFDYIYHFAAPSSQVQFKRKPQYCVETTLKGFMNVADATRKAGVRLIYPSTGILSHGQANEYARCKAICEDYAPEDSLGVRIFATYGPQEAHKGDWASVPYLFAKDLVNGRAPIVFGSGEQVRDFIYIDDTVNAIIALAEQCRERIVDIGSGTSQSFNKILTLLQTLIHDAPEPVYVDKPMNYVDETHADISVLKQYYTPKTDIKIGLTNIVESLKT